MRPLFAYCDGSIKVNPGGRAVSAWVLRDADVLVSQETIDLGIKPGNTVNVAEYTAVEHVLIWLKTVDIDWDLLKIHTDSQLVVKQLNCEWQCLLPHLVAYRDRILAMCKEFKNQSKKITFEWIPREANFEADLLSKSLYES